MAKQAAGQLQQEVNTPFFFPTSLCPRRLRQMLQPPKQHDCKECGAKLSRNHNNKTGLCRKCNMKHVGSHKK